MACLGSGNSGWNAGQDLSEQLSGGDVWFALTEWEFDGDGFLDYVVMGQWVSTLYTAKGNGNGTFDSFGQTEVCQNCEAGEVSAFDVNDDDRPDVIASFDSGVAVLLGKADGTFEAPSLYPWDGADMSAGGDIDNDGDMDFVVASRTTGNVALFLNNGDGTFEDAMNLSTQATSLRTVAMADLDEDGALDIATTYSAGGAGQVVVWLMNP